MDNSDELSRLMTKVHLYLLARKVAQYPIAEKEADALARLTKACEAYVNATAAGTFRRAYLYGTALVEARNYYTRYAAPHYRRAGQA